jgi:hypothetical protein
MLTFVASLLALPAGLPYSRDLTTISSLAETNTADPELSEVGMGTTADAAPIVAAHLVLWLALPLLNLAFFCHYLFPPLFNPP